MPTTPFAGMEGARGINQGTLLGLGGGQRNNKEEAGVIVFSPPPPTAGPPHLSMNMQYVLLFFLESMLTTQMRICVEAADSCS